MTVTICFSSLILFHRLNFNCLSNQTTLLTTFS